MNNKTEIELIVKNILTDKLGLDENEVSPSSILRDDLGMDSLDDVELIMELEKEFCITISDGEVEEIRTVEGVVEYLFGKLN